MISWVCFQWDLSSVQCPSPAISPLSIRPARSSDAKTVLKVINTAFELDSAWGDVVRPIQEKMKRHVNSAFENEEPACVVVQHGSRIIGASLLDLDPVADNHLLSGPMILHEYRNRGVGSGLLAASLEHLRSRGVAKALGVTRANSVVARFIYPKFSSAQIPFSGDPLRNS